MAARTGGNAIVAYKAGGATWHTALSVAANTGLLANIDNLVNTADMIPDAVAGYEQLQQLDKGQENVTPVISGNMRFLALPMFALLANLFGDDTVTGTGPTYTHTFNWQNEPALFGTLAAEIASADIIEWPSVKVVGLDISFGGDGFTEFAFRTICDTVEYGNNATNTTTTFNNVTYNSKVHRIPNLSWRLRMNDQSGAALATGDIIKVSDFKLTINRAIQPEMVTQGAMDGTEWQTDEPQKSGHDEITLSFTVPERSDLSLLQIYDNETMQKLDLYVSKSISGNTHDITFSFPALKPTPPDHALDTVERLAHTASFQALEATSAPTGFSSTDLIQLVTTDATSTSYESAP